MIIEMFANVLAWIIAMGIVIWIGLTLFRILLMNSKKKKGKKEALKLLNTFEEKFRYVYRMIFITLGIFINMAFATLLAIGSKPIIYKLNQPFVGEGYATFASYIVAIGIFMLMPRWFVKTRGDEK